MKKSKLQMVLAGMFGLGAVGCLIQFQLVSAIVSAVVAYFIYKHEPKEKQQKEKKVKEFKPTKKQQKIMKQQEVFSKAINDDLDSLNNEPMYEDSYFEYDYLKKRIVLNNKEYWQKASANEFSKAIIELKHVYKEANEKAKGVKLGDAKYDHISKEAEVKEMHVIHPEWKQGYILMKKSPKVYVTDNDYIELSFNELKSKYNF